MDDADEIDGDEGVEVAKEVHVAVDDDGGDVDTQIEVAEVEVDIVEEEEEELGNMMEENGPTNDVGARAVPEVPLPLVAAGDARGGGGAVDQGKGQLGWRVVTVEMMLEAKRAWSQAYSLRRPLFPPFRRPTPPIFQLTNGLPKPLDQSSPGLSSHYGKGSQQTLRMNVCG